MVYPPVGETIHSLNFVDYLLVQADKSWYNYSKTEDKAMVWNRHDLKARPALKKGERKNKNKDETKSTTKQG